MSEEPKDLAPRAAAVEVDREGWMAALDRAAALREFVMAQAGMIDECAQRQGLSAVACKIVAARMRQEAARSVPPADASSEREALYGKLPVLSIEEQAKTDPPFPPEGGYSLDPMQHQRDVIERVFLRAMVEAVVEFNVDHLRIIERVTRRYLDLRDAEGVANG